MEVISFLLLKTWLKQPIPIHVCKEPTTDKKNRKDPQDNVRVENRIFDDLNHVNVTAEKMSKCVEWNESGASIVYLLSRSQ